MQTIVCVFVSIIGSLITNCDFFSLYTLISIALDILKNVEYTS